MDNTTGTKALKLQDLTPEGNVIANVATIGQTDREGDVAEPGYFGQQKSRMLWGHQLMTWIGKGEVAERGDDVLFEGQFFMDTQTGSEAYKTVKAMGDLADWSYGYLIKPGGARKAAPNIGASRVLQPLPDGQPGVDLYEVSPVVRGAGFDTGTLAMKQWAPGLDLPADTKFSDQLQGTVVAIQQTIDRAAAIKQLRDSEGKPLGKQAVELLTQMADGLTELQGTVADLLPATEPTQDPPLTDPPDPDNPEVEGEAAAAMANAHAHMDQLVASLP